MTNRELVKMLTPPLLVRAYHSILNYGLSGDYHDWNEAVCASTGYDSEIILEKTKAALLKVKNGEAAYERDSVLFDEVQYAWPLLAGLMWVAARTEGKLSVLDFGGSLGSTYFQNRAFLRYLPDVRWNIVEQPQHVKVGKELFEDEHLRFYLCVEDCLAESQPNVVVLSSVLHYLERPYDTLSELLRLPCDHVIIDRTPFWGGPSDRLCVQKVPPRIYPASYPCWVFSSIRFHACLHDEWQIVAEFDSLDRLKSPVQTTWKGIVAVRQRCGENSINSGE
jgi:putative methyltransferase (TIGR04325 family)